MNTKTMETKQSYEGNTWLLDRIRHSTLTDLTFAIKNLEPASRNSLNQYNRTSFLHLRESTCSKLRAETTSDGVQTLSGQGKSAAMSTKHFAR